MNAAAFAQSYYLCFRLGFLFAQCCADLSIALIQIIEADSDQNHNHSNSRDDEGCCADCPLDCFALGCGILHEACGTNQFCMSFLVSDSSFALPGGRTRVYLENRTAADVKSLAEKLMLEQPEIKMVFLTDLKDTRFDAYGVLRPITSAQREE